MSYALGIIGLIILYTATQYRTYYLYRGRECIGSFTGKRRLDDNIINTALRNNIVIRKDTL
jgi:hypothetical protein